MSVGENISRMRAAKGLSQAELASKVGVCQSMVAQIERGSKMPTVTLANALAKAMGGKLSDIVDESA